MARSNKKNKNKNKQPLSSTEVPETDALADLNQLEV
jgi:hypothetical protein